MCSPVRIYSPKSNCWRSLLVIAASLSWHSTFKVAPVLAKVASHSTRRPNNHNRSAFTLRMLAQLGHNHAFQFQQRSSQTSETFELSQSLVPKWSHLDGLLLLGAPRAWLVSRAAVLRRHYPWSYSEPARCLVGSP